MEIKISKELIKAGLDNSTIKIVDHVPDHSNCGVAAMIGEYWFYFAGEQGETETAEELLKNTPIDTLVSEIWEAVNSEPIYNGKAEKSPEYNYYYFMLREELNKQKNANFSKQPEFKPSDIEGFPVIVFGEYVFYPCRNQFNSKISYWLSKRGYTFACYAFTAQLKKDAMLTTVEIQSYIALFDFIAQKHS